MNALAPIVQYDGLWWPASDVDARPVILRDRDSDIHHLLRFVPPDRRGVIVQAGANVGTYPLALTDHFSMVVTAEPDPVNFACLEKNLAARDSLRRVVAHHAGFGEAAGVCVPLEVQPRNCGANRVHFGKGDVPVITIDSLGLGACDVIWLDIEGAETFALKGALETIRRHEPVIRVEDKGLDRQFFGADLGEMQALMADLGYEEVARVGRDKIFRRA